MCGFWGVIIRAFIAAKNVCGSKFCFFLNELVRLSGVVYFYEISDYSSFCDLWGWTHYRKSVHRSSPALQNCGGLFLGCIEADFFEEILILHKFQDLRCIFAPR